MPLTEKLDREKLEAELKAQRARLELLKKNTSSKGWLSSPTVQAIVVNINRLEHAIASCGDYTPQPPTPRGPANLMRFDRAVSKE